MKKSRRTKKIKKNKVKRKKILIFVLFILFCLFIFSSVLFFKKSVDIIVAKNNKNNKVKTETVQKKDVVSDTNTASTSNVSSTNTSIDTSSPFLILVNRKYPLSDSFVPNDLILPNLPIYSQLDPSCRKINSEAAAALTQLFEDAKKNNISFYIQSGYRSYATQKNLLDYRTKAIGETQANKYIALPGTSEHQTGLAIDVLSTEYKKVDEGFANTQSYAWLKENCAKYGFIIRYPKGKEDITGYNFEPWHLRYLKDSKIAQDIMSRGITFEEYLNK